MKTLPKARQDNLIVRQVADEVLIYDQETHEARCLNRTAAIVWKYCDGHTPVEEIGRRVATEMTGDEQPIDQRLVWFALEQFERDRLLEGKLEAPAGLLATTGLNRRKALRALGLTAMIALPLVTSMIAPTAAEAATCRAPTQPCTSPAQCCSSICTGGTTCA